MEKTKTIINNNRNSIHFNAIRIIHSFNHSFIPSFKTLLITP